MRLIFKTRSGTTKLEWCDYALLRDNVQHYLESGPGQTAFAALHAVEHVVDGEPGSVSALELRRELQRAWSALADLKFEQAAVSLRSRAILTGCDRAPTVRGTAIAKLTGWPLPVVGDGEQPLRAHLANFVNALLTIIDSAATEEDVCLMWTESALDPLRASGHRDNRA